MKRAIILSSLLAIAVLGSVYWTARVEPASHDGSPAFQALLDEAIARLEGATQEVTKATVGEAHAEAQQYTMSGATCDGTETCDGSPGCEYETVYGQFTCDRDHPDCWELTYDPTVPTCDPGLVTCDASATCARFYTCDSQFTCHGEPTCDGSDTCWNSTCDEPLQTCDGSITCTGGLECDPYTFQGNYTCDGTETCHSTCAGWPTCDGGPTCDGTDTCDNTCDGWPGCGPTGTDRTTWGGVKKEFSE